MYCVAIVLSTPSILVWLHLDTVCLTLTGRASRIRDIIMCGRQCHRFVTCALIVVRNECYESVATFNWSAKQSQDW